MSIRLGVALIVFALNLWALRRLHAQGRPRRDRMRWTLVIVALPVVGILLWRRNSNRKARAYRLEARNR